MGQRLIALAHADPQFEVAAALESPEHARFGLDAGEVAGIGQLEVPIGDSLPADIDALIDFSVPFAAVEIIQKCAEAGVPVVLATTGLDDGQQGRVAAAAERIPICWAPNMSLAVNLTMKLAEIAGRALRNHPGGADVEIIECHHRFKEDAPSGTALQFGRILADTMGMTQAQHGREGRPGPRPRDEIGFHAVRAGDNPGEHTILFGLLGESIELRVAATNRDCYAQGALAAARWLVGKSAGRYDMKDVLGL